VEIVALATGVTPAAVRHWASGLREMPASTCPIVESITRVPCEELRTDLLWERDDVGRVTGYRVPLPSAPTAAKPPSPEQ